MTIVYICIGNTDKRLLPVEYQTFIKDVDTVVGSLAIKRGFWRTQVGSEYQNACWCIEIKDEVDKDLRDDLRILASRYRQDSIKYDVVTDPVFLKPNRGTE